MNYKSEFMCQIFMLRTLVTKTKYYKDYHLTLFHISIQKIFIDVNRNNFEMNAYKIS